MEYFFSQFQYYMASAAETVLLINKEIFSFFLVAPTFGGLLPLLEHRAEFPQFLDQGQSVGLLGRVISSSQGLYLYTNTEKRTHMHK
jgi:hypothetical protein